jgi:capsular exopolysaccharide synthesis family protein
LVAGLFREKLDTKAHTPEDVEQAFGLTTLALIPEAKVLDSSRPGERITMGNAKPGHAFSEGFRLLRNNIGFSSLDRPIRVIGVTSAMAGEGKSTISMNLAIAMAKDGKRVLLVDADLRRPTIHEWVRVENSVGLSSVVRGAVPLSEAIFETEYGISCLLSGPLPPEPAEFLNSGRCYETIRQASEQFDVVILDAPPCIGLSDTQVISHLVDGVIIVAALEMAPKPLMVGSIRMLRQANANVLGLVINRVRAQNSTKYGYLGLDSYYDPGRSTDRLPLAEEKHLSR